MRMSNSKHPNAGHKPARRPIRMGNRRAFTLIELLVVVAIIIVLAGITLAFLPKQEVRLAARGADQLQTYIAAARSRAMRDQAPRGIQLINDGTGRYRSVQLIEVPEPYIPTNPTPPATAGNHNPVAPPVTMQINNADPRLAHFFTVVGTPPNTHNVPFNFTGSGLAVGDLLEIVEGVGACYKVWTDDGATPPTHPTPTNLPGGVVALRSPVTEASTSNFTITNNYRFIRQARPLMGEPILELPDTVYVSSLSTQSQNFQSQIIFGPSGQVLQATGGRIVLWVTDDNSVSKPTLLTIYTLTGSVAAHPAAPGNNPWLYTQDGLNSGQ